MAGSSKTGQGKVDTMELRLILKMFAPDGQLRKLWQLRSRYSRLDLAVKANYAKG